MMRVAVIDPLRVELMVPTALYGTLSPGDKVSDPSRTARRDAGDAVVRHVDQVLDAASNTFRVRLTLPNPDHRLPAGLRCKAELPVTAAAAAASAPSEAGAGVRPQAAGRRQVTGALRPPLFAVA